jgi:hypothetical protein
MILVTTTCIFYFLSGCGSIAPVVRTPTISSLPRQESDIPPTPEGTNNGDEMENSSVIVPLRNSPIIDGILSPGEWDDAAIEAFADGSQLLFMQTGDYLYLGVRANESGMIAGNVFIRRGDEITILHSSAALGTASYQKNENGWQQIRDFTWRCRYTGNSESAQIERAKFLQEEGWLAANGLMGTPNELEYQIKIPDQSFRLAVVFIRSSYLYEKVPWPADLNDDCIKPTPGELPSILSFSPDEWRTINLINSRKDDPTE